MPKTALPPFECRYTGPLLAGVDEVGRGPLIGAVVTAAVLLHWLVMFAAFGTIFTTSQIAINNYLSQISDTTGVIS